MMNSRFSFELGTKEFKGIQGRNCWIWETIFWVLQAIFFGHELHEFSRILRNCFVKIRVIRVKKVSLAAPKK
jgi:hypothetical protein